MQKIAAEFVAQLQPDSRAATVVTLQGDLGAGKTTFAQGVAHALGVEETVTSPTFVIEKIYQLENQRWQHLVHVDAYRLKSEHELEVLGWSELLAERGNLVVLEWPERVAEALPDTAIRITLTGSGDTREISYGEKEGGK